MKRKQLSIMGLIMLCCLSCLLEKQPVAAEQASKLVRTQKEEYAAGEAIVVEFSGLPGNQKDWITIVPKGSSDQKYAEYFYTQGQTEGVHTFKGLKPGEYEVRVFFDYPSGGYTVHDRFSFKVIGAVNPEITCTQSRCEIKNAMTEDLIAQIREEIDLKEAWVELKNISNDDLKVLSALKDDLVHLAMTSSKNLTEITPISAFSQLRSLKLESLEKVSDLAPLSTLTNLDKLEIRWTPFTSFEFLRPLHNLEELNLSKAPAECPDSSVFAGKPKLKVLDVSNVKITDLAFLKETINLETLKIGGTLVEDLSPLTALQRLKELYLYGGVPAKDFSPVGELAELTYIQLEKTEFADYSALAGCAKLVQLIAWYSSFDNLEVIRTMPKLSKLLLSNTPIQQWEPLKTAKNLWDLRLGKTSFSDVSLLVGMEKLRMLNLSKTTMTHPEALSQLLNLDILTILETQGLTDLAILETIPKLNTLYLTKGQFLQEQIDALKAAKPKLRINFH